MRGGSLLLYGFFASRQMACQFVYHDWNVIRSNAHTFPEIGVDLRAEEQDDREVVEEEEQNDCEAYSAGIASQEVGHVKWKQ